MKSKLSLLLLVLSAGVTTLSISACDSQGMSAGTGKLRVLVTDKPFPFDLIEEATITVTRVEVRLADGEEQCVADADCDDGQFCNGAEYCAGGECEEGVEPCVDEELCDEDSATCVADCMTDEECDDGLFCTGVETCLEARCTEGAEPCMDDEICDESLRACVPSGEGGAKVRSQMQGRPPDVGGESEEGDDELDGQGQGGMNGNGSPFITIFEGEKTFNLLELQNGRTDLLADVDVPAGTYTQMRLIVTEGQVTLKDGAGVFKLVVPSGAETGIKLHFTFEVSDGEETALLLDVDVSQLFIPVPGGMIEDPSTIETFLFRPSVAMRLINLLDAGSISGFISDEFGNPLADVTVTVYENSEEVTSTATESDGSYLLGGLTTGEYDLEFSLAGFADAALPGISVIAGETTTAADVAMAAAP